MSHLNTFSIGAKIHISIMTNVILAIFIGHYFVTGYLKLEEPTAFFVNLAMNGFIAFVYGYFVSKAITNPLQDVLARLKAMADGQGDLTQHLPVETDDEVGDLSRTFNRFLDKLHDIIFDVSKITDELLISKNGFNELADEIQESAKIHSDKTNYMVKEVEKMRVSVNSISQSANQAQLGSTEAEKKAQQGGEVVRQTILGMEDVSGAVNRAAQTMMALKQSSDHISEIVVVISTIAEQTNLLALNAAIEAARAGEQGRGFAVVADEVRALAARTSSATQEINGMISDIQEKMNDVASLMDDGVDKVKHGVNSSNEAGLTLDEIVGRSHKLRQMMEDISSGVKQHLAFASTISNLIQESSVVTERSNASVGNVVQYYEGLSNKIESLNIMVKQFKLKDGQHPDSF